MTTAPTDPSPDDTAADRAQPKPLLSEAAQRAIAEADARRGAAAAPSSTPQEIGGRNGPEPTRYGDWEAGGIVSDF